MQQQDPGSDIKFGIKSYVKVALADKQHANGRNPESIYPYSCSSVNISAETGGIHHKTQVGMGKDLTAPEDTLSSLSTCNCQPVHRVIIPSLLELSTRRYHNTPDSRALHLNGGKIQRRYFLNPLVALSCGVWKSYCWITTEYLGLPSCY